MGEQRKPSSTSNARPADRQGRTAAGDIPRADAYGRRPWSEEAMKTGEAPYESRPSPPPGAEDEGHGYTQDSGYPQSKGYHGESGVAEPYAPEGGFGSAEKDPTDSSSERRASDAAPAQTDARLQEEVRERLKRERLDPRDLAVRVQDGVVTLEGRVAGARERMRAQELAEGVRGVQRVENRLRTEHHP